MSAVVSENSVESVGGSGRGEVDVETGSAGLLLTGRLNAAGLVENEDADGEKKTLRMGGADTDERDSDLRRSRTASLTGLETPR